MFLSVRILQVLTKQDSQEDKGRSVQADPGAEIPHQERQAKQEAVGRSHGVTVTGTGKHGCGFGEANDNCEGLRKSPTLIKWQKTLSVEKQPVGN